MRVSEYYQLPRTQAYLDFIDVDVVADLPVFLDPTALLRLPTPWAAECIAPIQDFFQHILALIGGGRDKDAKDLLAALREPNETRLGLSKGRARGRGLGPESAHWVWAALRESRAIQTGLLQHLEDTILMVEGVAADLVSDIATNLIRQPLAAYTLKQCVDLGIPTVPGVAIAPLWYPDTKCWGQEFAELPYTRWSSAPARSEVARTQED